MHAYIITHDGTNRTASIHDHPDLVRAWIGWTRTLVEEALPGVTVQLMEDPADTDPLRALASRAPKGERGRTLLVSPFAGCLSRQRLRDFVDHLLSLEVPAVLRSRYKVAANANPIWLRPLPQVDDPCSSVEVPWAQLFQKTAPENYCRVMAENCTGKDIRGSQHLPDMYAGDDVLVGLIPADGGRPAVERYHYYDQDADPSLLMIYRLGIMNLHPRHRLRLSPKLAKNMADLLNTMGTNANKPEAA